MKYLLIIVILLILSCSSTNERYDNGQIKEDYINKEELIHNFPSLGKITYYKSGAVESICLSKDFALSIGVIPRGSKVFFNNDGSLLRLESNKTINIYGADFIATEKRQMLFYPETETLKSAYLSVDSVILGVPCKASKATPVYFYPNGKIKSCKLSKNFTYNDVEYSINTKIYFDNNKE